MGISVITLKMRTNWQSLVVLHLNSFVTDILDHFGFGLKSNVSGMYYFEWHWVGSSFIFSFISE